MKRPFRDLVCAIHPTSRGFGWCIFEAPLSPVDWGIASAKPGRHSRSMARFERLLNRYEPLIVAFEEYEQYPAKRAERIKKLYRSMIHLANTRGAHTPVYSREAIRTCFSSIGARTRYEIAQAIAQHIPEFRRHLPKERKAWMSEDFRQCLFDAAALVLTHFAVTGMTMTA